MQRVRYITAMVTLRISAPRLALMSNQLRQLSQGQFEKAVKNGTTRTARKFVEFKKAKIDQDVDKPTPFTKRAYDYDKADASGRARVFVRPKQAQYLAPMEFGQTVRKRGKWHPLSIVDSQKNQYGNLRGGRVRRDSSGNYVGGGIGSRFNGFNNSANARLAARGGALRNGAKRYFVGKLNNKTGVFVRTKRARGWEVKMLIRFLDSVTYRPTLNFRKDAREYGQRHFGRNVNEEITRLLSRRRR